VPSLAERLTGFALSLDFRSVKENKAMPSLEPEELELIEEALTSCRPFGESEYISAQIDITYTHRLDRLSTHLPSAGTLLRALERTGRDERYRVFGNTVVRCTIQHARAQIEAESRYGLPLTECERVLETVASHLDSGLLGTPFENGKKPLCRLGVAPHHGWIWDEERPHDLLGECFRFLIKQNYGDRLSSPTAEEIQVLKKGAQLLEKLLPQVGPSAMRHAHLIGCFPDFGTWRGKQSSSQFRIGGTIFLSRRHLRSAWWVAEHLFHEALHQKLYDFRHGHSVIEPRVPGQEPIRVRSPWNAEKLVKANYWDTHRVLAAFHVYVHLSLLSQMAEHRRQELESEYGPKVGMIESRSALDRARYLGEQLKSKCWSELGLAGKHLVERLITVLDCLDLSPPPPGAELHLLLDLYIREATEVDSVLVGKKFVRDVLIDKLERLAVREVEHTHFVLSAISADRMLVHQFNEAVERYSNPGLGESFPGVRRTVAKTLRESSIDGYRLPCGVPTSVDAIDSVREIVERGSEQLHVMLAGVPHVVAAAKQRAKELCYSKSCRDTVGRLLSALAAAVPTGGRILEIGTGAGVGTAWISSGLADRSDVELISVEIESRLADASRQWPWPSWVRIIGGDVTEILPGLGGFQLVFADASPYKYTHIDSVIRAMCCRGVLVLDDLDLSMHESETCRADIEGLRRFLLYHPQLQTCELDWSTGVILTTALVGIERDQNLR
jgi:predicted O-methyltransferase YrrM